MLSKLMIRRFSTSLLRQRGLVIGAYESGEGADCLELSPVGQKLDDGLEGKLREALNGMPTGIGKLGKVTTLTNLSEEFPQIAVAGLGSKDADFDQIEYLDEGRESVRIATGVGARALQAMGVNDIAVEGFNKPETAAEGSTLGVWYFSDKDVETKVALYEGGDPEDWERGVTKADAQNLVRCLCETPPNYMTPRVLAMRARDLLCPYGVQVYARDTRWMKIHHFDSLLSLGASSTEPPMLLEISYCADTIGASKPYMFIGQGTTSTSGGLCLRECHQMMRADFASAAILMGVIKAVSAMRLPINVRAFIPLYEDRLGGTSMKPGDALRVRGSVLATEHTQNFPQVVAAEALAYATKKFPPEMLFAIGTYSPNVQSMIGATSAVWSRNDYVWDHVNYAGAVTGDRMWRMPLFHDYHKSITERVDVDVTNLGIGRKGEPNLIAAFFNFFAAPELDFTYIDVTGASDTANGYVHYLAPNLFTGAPTRALIQLLCHLNYCKEQVRAAAKGGAKSDREN